MWVVNGYARKDPVFCKWNIISQNQLLNVIENHCWLDIDNGQRAQLDWGPSFLNRQTQPPITSLTDSVCDERKTMNVNGRIKKK